MKKIEAIIRSSKFEVIKELLEAIGTSFFAFLEGTDCGKEKARMSYPVGRPVTSVTLDEFNLRSSSTCQWCAHGFVTISIAAASTTCLAGVSVH